jgi:sugar phosphate isomerase/epimerase
MSTNILGIFTGFGIALPLPERLRAIKAAGFEATSLWWGVFGHVPIARLHDAPAMVREAGLVLENVHVPFADANDLWAATARLREEAVARYIGWLDDCARHAIPAMVMHLTSGWALPTPTDDGMAAMRRIVAAAEERGVMVAVENTRRPDYLDRVFGEIDSPCLGLCYDSSHDRLWGGEPLRRWGHRLAVTHLSDNDGCLDRHMLPGDGVIDWPAVMGAIPPGYAGPLSLEVVAARDAREASEMEAFLAEAYRRATWLAEGGGSLGDCPYAQPSSR